MNFLIERVALMRSLGHVQSVVERRNTIPIVSHVLMEAADGQLHLAATDLDLEIEETVGADVTRSGRICVPAHTLYDIVRKLPEGAQVEIEAGGDASQLTLKAGRSRFRLSCLPPDDFPHVAGVELPHQFSLPAEKLQRLIDHTRFAISTEETRYYLNGIFVHVGDSAGGGELDPGQVALRAAATDGHRLARVEMRLPEGAANLPGIIVPRKTINEVRKLVEDAADEVTIAISETQIQFSIDAIRVTSKLIDGTFPDYERVIPSGNSKVLEVDARLLLAAVDRVATISTDKSRAIKLSLDSNSLTLTATSPDAGSATEEIEVLYDDAPLDIGFNSRYLIDVLQQVGGDSARFILGDAAAPTLVQDKDDASALYVIMPMRV